MADTKITALTAHTALIDTDVVPVVDTTAVETKKTTWANIKLVLKTYFDTLYNLYVHPNHTGDVTYAADGATVIADGVVTEAMQVMANNTTQNASTSKHGYLLKATAPAANLLNVVGIAEGETIYANKAIFDATNPAAVGTAAPGTSLCAAHRDHVHALGTGIGAVQTVYCTTQCNVTNSTIVIKVLGTSLNLVSGKAYKIHMALYTTSGIGGGVKPSTGGTATTTAWLSQGIVYSGNAVVGNVRVKNRNWSLAGVTAVTAAFIVIDAYYRVNNGGTFYILFAQNVANEVTSSVLVGSFMTVQQLD